MDKQIYIFYKDKLTPITELGRVDYENFLEAMLKLNSAYIKAVREQGRKEEWKNLEKG